ncbi:Pro-Pol polyprotein [Araneus ventricosus]|uniref:Pro-Pol polyprotein n=1 Tax=Araneus ventricosus TaxID=182803 RepID=A0A4Y2EPC3_ARAVE|nr:Pro-Pol polyprotein [Araneus ventricosus]
MESMAVVLTGLSGSLRHGMHFGRLFQNFNFIQNLTKRRRRSRPLVSISPHLSPIPKEDVPLSTYHVNFIGPLHSTNKKYQHILTIVDAFTTFTWLYPVKSTSTEDALDKLKVQQKTFGNPKRIITDRGSAFISKAFGDYCTNENIQHFQITTGVPRGNGQVERLHRTLIPVLTKLSIADSTKWFKFVDPLQRNLNSTFNRSTKWSPFELLIGVTMRNKEDLHLRDLLMEEMMEELQE